MKFVPLFLRKKDSKLGTVPAGRGQQYGQSSPVPYHRHSYHHSWDVRSILAVRA